MSTMEYRRLGRSGLEASVLCLGTMTFGDRTSADEARAIVASARDAGVNFIDTADAYVKGESERIVGAAIKPHRRHWILATKAGNVLTARPHDGGLSRRWLVQACEDSLGRLGTDWIDIYYLHKDDWATPIAETVGAIGDLIRAGKIRYFGVSNYRGWRIAEVVRECARQNVPPPVVLPAVLQPAEPHAGGRDPARLRSLRHRRGRLLADRAWRALRQVRAPTARPRRDSRAAVKDERFLETEHRAESYAIAQHARGARAAHGAHVDGLRARVAVGEPHPVLGGRGPAHARAVARLRRGDGHRVVREDEALVDALVRPGHPSTPGYTDPRYPFFGRRLG